MASNFPSDIEGSRIICREMLMDGPLSDTLDQNFYRAREAYLTAFYSDSQVVYTDHVRPELEKLKLIPTGSLVYLWFEYDLFCQVNLWACCNWVSSFSKESKLSWVTPSHEDWSGFGELGTDALARLLSSEAVISLTEGRLLEFKNNLVEYSKDDYTSLAQYIERVRLSPPSSLALRAQLDRLSNGSKNSLLEAKVGEMIETEGPSFGKVFQRFCKEEGRYGMGDIQFRLIYERVLGQN